MNELLGVDDELVDASVNRRWLVIPSAQCSGRFRAESLLPPTNEKFRMRFSYREWLTLSTLLQFLALPHRSS